MKDVVSTYRGWNMVSKVESRREKRARYLYSKQGKGINVLACFGQSLFDSAHKKHATKLYVGDYVVELDYSNVYVDFRAQQVLTYILHLFVCQLGSKPTEEEFQRACYVTLDVKDVAELFDMGIHGVRKMLCRSVDALYSISLNWSEKSRKPLKNGTYVYNHYTKMRILGRYDYVETVKVDDSALVQSGRFKIVDNKLTVRLDSDFAKYVSTSYPIYYPEALFRIVPSRMANAFPFAIKLLTMYKMNRKNSNHHICSVEALINSSTDIPWYSEISKTGEICRKIIRPTIKGLNYLLTLNILSYCYFVDKDNNQYSFDDVLSFSYEKFHQLSVVYDFVDYPDKHRVTKILGTGQIGMPLYSDYSYSDSDDEFVSAYNTPYSKKYGDVSSFQLSLF